MTGSRKSNLRGSPPTISCFNDSSALASNAADRLSPCGWNLATASPVFPYFAIPCLKFHSEHHHVEGKKSKSHFHVLFAKHFLGQGEYCVSHDKKIKPLFSHLFPPDSIPCPYCHATVHGVAELDTTERLNIHTHPNLYVFLLSFICPLLFPFSHNLLASQTCSLCSPSPGLLSKILSTHIVH